MKQPWLFILWNLATPLKVKFLFTIVVAHAASAAVAQQPTCAHEPHPSSAPAASGTLRAPATLRVISFYDWCWLKLLLDTWWLTDISETETYLRMYITFIFLSYQIVSALVCFFYCEAIIASCGNLRLHICSVPLFPEVNGILPLFTCW